MRAVDHTDEWARDFGNAILKALEAIGGEAEGDCAELCPVNTGRLQGSITHAVLDGERAVIVGTDVEYAAAVELNEKARHKNGQAHFMRDGVTRNKGKYQDIFDSHMRNA